MMHMSSVAGGALTIYVKAMLQHKLYSDPIRAHDTSYNRLDIYIVLFIAILTVVILIKVGIAPSRCIKRLMGSLTFCRRNKQYYLI